jgi:hypothetical protein
MTTRFDFFLEDWSPPWRELSPRSLAPVLEGCFWRSRRFFQQARPSSRNTRRRKSTAWVSPARFAEGELPALMRPALPWGVSGCLSLHLSFGNSCRGNARVSFSGAPRSYGWESRWRFGEFERAVGPDRKYRVRVELQRERRDSNPRPPLQGIKPLDLASVLNKKIQPASHGSESRVSGWHILRHSPQIDHCLLRLRTVCRTLPFSHPLQTRPLS